MCIRDSVNVVLEQPEIDPGGIVVVKLAERAVLGQLLDFLDRAREQEGVIDHDRQVLLRGQFDQLFGLRHSRRKWFLDKNVFPVLQGCLGQLEVGPNGRDHGDSVNLRRRQHFRNVARGAHTWIGALNPLSLIHI